MKGIDIMSDGFTDAKSDLYSLGIVMYEMLTAKVPFDADTPVSVALKQVQEEPVDPITYNPDIPVSVNRIILKAMQKEPSMRYGAASEMIRDLEMCVKDETGSFVRPIPEVDEFATKRISSTILRTVATSRYISAENESPIPRKIPLKML